jgi:hypothetical protein
VDLSTLSDLATLIGLITAIAAAFYAWREWRHKTDHWLYIPEPEPRQSPLDPAFWVFPPLPWGDGYAVPIRGKVLNSGPSDAFSVRVFGDQELPWDEAREVVSIAASFALSSKALEGDPDPAVVLDQFLGIYRSKGRLAPVLRVGEELDFVVVVKFEKESRYIAALPKEAGIHQSAPWCLDDRQAHKVRASSRTSTRRIKRFGPDQLCAPFEEDR